MHSLDLRPDRSFLELPMKLLYSGLCELYDSFDKVVPWHQQGMSCHIRVHGHSPLTILQWVRWHSDQGHTFQDHSLEVHDAVDFYWLFTWWLSSVRSSHLSRYKRISCESHVYSPKNQTQNPDWQVTLEQLQDIPEVMIQRWQMVVMYGALMEEMVSFLGSRIELNRSYHPWLPTAAECKVLHGWLYMFFRPEGTWYFCDCGMHNCWHTYADSSDLSLLVSSQGSGVPDVQYACVHLLCFFMPFLSRGGCSLYAEYRVMDDLSSSLVSSDVRLPFHTCRQPVSSWTLDFGTSYMSNVPGHGFTKIWFHSNQWKPVQRSNLQLSHTDWIVQETDFLPPCPDSQPVCLLSFLPSLPTSLFSFFLIQC